VLSVIDAAPALVRKQRITNASSYIFNVTIEFQSPQEKPARKAD
jgi:hypothetical protein